MSDELVEAVEAALVPSTDIEELKPDRARCSLCDRRAVRSDGKCAKHSGFRLTQRQIVAAAGDMIARHQAKYARIHLRGALVAAAKGDTKPAEWALIHGGAVKPVEKQVSSSNGVTVNVGIVLPGLKEGV